MELGCRAPQRGIGEFGGEQCMMMHICQNPLACTVCRGSFISCTLFSIKLTKSGVHILRSALCSNPLAFATACAEEPPESAGSTLAALRASTVSMVRVKGALGA